MGRLSYVNRKIDGLKLGQVVARDLIKRVPPAVGSKAAFRDPVLELDVSSKQLKDDGLAEVMTALIESARYDGVMGKVVLLEDLSLRENGLTITALRMLASVVRLTGNDLRDLDLANNLIKVESLEDVQIWEEFLHSLSHCCVLRRIDISGNPLGVKAFEVLARVSAREEAIEIQRLPCGSVLEGFAVEMSAPEKDLSSTLGPKICKMNLDTGSEGHNGNTEAHSDEVESSLQSKIHKSRRRQTSIGDSPNVSMKKLADSRSIEKPTYPAGSSNASDYSSTRGLNSIPYIILSDTSMTDSCALYLSYVIETHHLPDFLLEYVPPAKAGQMQQQLISYDNDTKCRGIIYLPNTALGNIGQKLLDLSEQTRTTFAESINSPERLDTMEDPLEKIQTPRRPSTTRRSLMATPSSQERGPLSTQSCDSSPTNGSVLVLSDLERARSRIQVEMLESSADGRLQNDLWKTALNMLWIARAFQYHKPRISTTPPPVAPKAIIKTLIIPGMSSKQLEPPTTPARPPTTVHSNGWTTPRSGRCNRRSSTIESPAISSIQISPRQSLRGRSLSSSFRAANKPYVSDLQFGFSEETWRCILADAVEAKGILSHKQQLSVVRWAMDRSTFSQEREWLGLKEGNQIWHVLDAMKCLAYESDM